MKMLLPLTAALFALTAQAQPCEITAYSAQLMQLRIDGGRLVYGIEYRKPVAGDGNAYYTELSIAADDEAKRALLGMLPHAGQRGTVQLTIAADASDAACRGSLAGNCGDFSGPFVCGIFHPALEKVEAINDLRLNLIGR